MKPLKKLSSSSTSKSPYSFFLEYFNPDGKEKAGFNLKPTYQRNVVWGDKEKIKFIESVFMA